MKRTLTTIFITLVLLLSVVISAALAEKTQVTILLYSNNINGQIYPAG